MREIPFYDHVAAFDLRRAGERFVGVERDKPFFFARRVDQRDQFICTTGGTGVCGRKAENEQKGGKTGRRAADG